MSSISSAISAPHAPPPAKSTGSASSTLVTDEATAKTADAASVKATAQVATDQQTKAKAATVQADEKAATTDQAAATKADAVVTADENSSGVNVTA